MQEIPYGNQDDATVVEKVNLYDMSTGWKLPNGIIVTPEAWNSITPDARRALLDRPAPTVTGHGVSPED